MGGAVSAIEEGFMQKEIADASYRYQKEIENNQNLAYLLTGPFNKITCPNLDANGWVSNPITSEIRIPITPDKIESLKKARKIAFSAKFSTGNQPTKVSFKSHYKLDLLLVADINYSTKQ